MVQGRQFVEADGLMSYYHNSVDTWRRATIAQDPDPEPLKRTLANAEIVGSSIGGAVEMLRSGRVDVFAANKANLFEISDKLPGSQVLEGRFSVDRFALGVPKGREAGLAYVRRFIEDAKSEGLVGAAIKKAGVRGTID